MFYRLIVTAICIVGILSSIYVGFAINQSNRVHIIDRVNTLAQVINPDDILSLSADKNDLENTSYIKVKKLLTDIRAVNSDIRFIYLNGINDGKMFFFVDSEDSQSEDYSPPGQSYEEATPMMFKVFETKENYFEISSDRWGYWVSAYAPLIKNGKVIALVGMDMPAKAYILNIVVNSVLPLLVMIIVLGIIVASKKANDKKAHFLSMVTHDIRNPLTGIRWSSDALSKDDSINEENRQTLSEIHKTTVKMIDTINDFKF